LILMVGAAGWLAHQPLILTSLGPTAYELIETSHRRSAQVWSVLGGHNVAVGAGFLALFVTGAWSAHPVSASGVPLPRVWAAVAAAVLTVLVNLLLKASQPAALSTTLLTALGTMQLPRDAAIILGAVVLMLLAGEPLRRLRLRHKAEQEEME
jgi:hypothetical protein